jgi:hypothetical protein
MTRIKFKKSFFLPIILIAATLFIAYGPALVSFSIAGVKMTNLNNRKISALGVAEAGVNYYLWHFQHFAADYCDGQTCPELDANGYYGPFTHEYRNTSSNELIGSYTLYIMPPEQNTPNNLPIVKSIGKLGSLGPYKTIITEIGQDHITKYAAFSNGSRYPLFFGTNFEFFGPLHSNGPIYFAAKFSDTIPSEKRVVSSATKEFPASNTGEWGYLDIPEIPIYCSGSPVICPGIWGIRPNINGSAVFPVPSINVDTAINESYFDGLKQKAIADTTLNPDNPTYFDVRTIGTQYPACRSSAGYGIMFTNQGIDIYRMRFQGGAQVARDRCYTILDSAIDSSLSRVIYFDGTPSGTSPVSNNYDVFLLGGEFDNRVTVVSGGRMFINDMNLTYAAYDGTTNIGIIARTAFQIPYRQNFSIPPERSLLKIAQHWDGVFLSTDGIIQYILNPGLRPTRGTLNLYGSIIDKTGSYYYKPAGGGTTYTWGEDWVKVNITPNPFPPPPSFPALSQYSIISWREE